MNSRMTGLLKEVEELEHEWQVNVDGEVLGSDAMHLAAYNPIFDAHQAVLDGQITADDLVLVLDRVFSRLYTEPPSSPVLVLR